MSSQRSVGLSSLITLMAVVGCDPPTQLIVVTYGGGTYEDSVRSVYADPFGEETSTRIKVINWGAQYGLLKTMVNSGNVDWDVVDIPAQHFRRGIRDELFQKLDHHLNKCEFLPGALTEFGIANLYWATVLAFDPKTYPNKRPSGWRDFWNVDEFPGPRAIYDSPRGNLEFALLADGVEKHQLYPLDVDRAFRKLSTIKSQIRVFWKDGSQPLQLLLTNTVSMSTAWNGRLFASKQARDELAYTWMGAALEVDYWVIPKAAKNSAKALEFILFASDPSRMAKQVKLIGYGPSNVAALKELSPNERSALPTSPQNLKKSFEIDVDWWAQNEDQTKERWMAWKPK